MTGKIKIILSFSFCIFILLVINFVLFFYTSKYKDSASWTNHSQEVISEAQRVFADVQDMETAYRGYVITGKERYLKPYYKTINDGDSTLAKLEVLVSDNPQQQALLRVLDSLIRLKKEFVMKVIHARKKEFSMAQALISSDMGDDLMQEIRIVNEKIIGNEKDYLGHRLSIAGANFRNVVRIIFISLALSILLIFVALYFFINDYNRRVLSEQKVIESELLLKKFLDALPLGIFILDGNGKAYYANNRSQEILGKGIVPDLPGTEFPKVYQAYRQGTDELYPGEEQPIVRVLKGEKDICTEDLEVLKNGIRVPLRINATSVPDSEGKIAYAIAVFEDITDIQKANRELLKAKIVAEEAVRIKDAFLSNMSHEIRTPMNAIIGFADILSRRDLRQQEKEYADTIKTAGENLLRIINDILDISKIEARMMSFEEHPLSINEIFKSLYIMLSQKAKEKDLELIFSCHPDVPDVLLGDPTRLTQIIINLVGNALKFTKNGSVKITAKVFSEREKFEVEFEISDTGIGIPEDQLDNIFKRFRQAETLTTRQYGGTGLGLSIAKQLVELQHGRISVRSKQNEGSVFSFVLPFKKTEEMDAANIPSYKKEINVKELVGLKIILAEDNPVNVKLITSLFADHGLTASVVENGSEVIALLKNNTYDLILMDMEMPVMDGYEATIAIRKQNDATPIIAMTAHAMAGEREKCLLLGMNEYVSKPIIAKELFEKMYTVTRKIQQEKNKQAEKKVATDLSYLVEIMGGKKTVVGETIDMILEQVPLELSMLNEAVKNSNYSIIRQKAHKLISTTSIVRISDLPPLLNEIERLATSSNDIEKIKLLCVEVNTIWNVAEAELRSERENLL